MICGYCGNEILPGDGAMWDHNYCKTAFINGETWAALDEGYALETSVREKAQRLADIRSTLKKD